MIKKLSFGLLGVHSINEGELGLILINEEELRRLALETLAIEPLGKILNPSFIERIYPVQFNDSLENKFKYFRSLKKEYNFDILAVIDKELGKSVVRHEMGFADYKDMVVYSELYPRVLAHEIGHLFKLKHSCKSGVGCWNCTDWDNIMCAVNHPLTENSFSTEQKNKILDYIENGFKPQSKDCGSCYATAHFLFPKIPNKPDIMADNQLNEFFDFKK